MSLVMRFPLERVEDLRAFLLKGGFRLDARPNAVLFAQRPGVSLTAYRTGKLLVTGAQAAEFAGVLEGNNLAKGEPRTDVAPRALGGGAPFEPHAGSDESGKGDYFGPLCVATVLVPDEATARLLAEKGVRDSKLVGAAEVGPLAALVRARCPHAVRALAPPRYNDVYERFGNLNHLLAALHAECIEKVIEDAGAPVPVLVDQFAFAGVLERHLGERARAARVEQTVRAESDIAVAAASIVARAEFLAGIRALEVQHGVRLPLGAGPPVTRAARDVAMRGGRELLRQVAKVHFATTRAALR